MSEHQPQHVGFIMDGNRRWADGKTLTVFEGHYEGARRIEPLIEYAGQKEIPHLTFYSFSTENWNRDQAEVAGLMNVFRGMLNDPVVDRLKDKGARVNMIGDYEKFPSDIVEKINEIHKNCAENTRITVNFALNYGGHEEIVHATNEAIQKNPNTPITEEMIEDNLYTAGQPRLDLMVRTGGEQRLSNFMPWQIIYAELYFTDILWPDFKPENFENALREYGNRNRRFGK